MMGDFIEPPDPRVKKANLRLLIAMIIFSLAFTALVIFWMHLRSERIEKEKLQGVPAISLLDSRRFSC